MTLKLSVIAFMLAFIASLSLSSNSYGDFLIYDNMAGGAGGVDNFLRSDRDEPFITADDVTLATTTGITRVEWTGIYFEFGPGSSTTPAQTDDFTIAVFADSGGMPFGGNPIAEFHVGNEVNRVDSGFTGAVNRDVFEYSAEIAFTMNAGITYWVSIANYTPGIHNDFYGGILSGAGNAFHSTNGGATWVDRTHRLDFRLIGIPEPATLTLLSISLCMFFHYDNDLRFSRRRRGKLRRLQCSTENRAAP